MKKTLLLIVILGLTAGISSAQIVFGPKIGYNASELSTSLSSVSTSFNSGFHFGAFLRLGKKAYIQPELYYTSQASTFQNDSANAGMWKQKMTIGTMDIPVLVGFRLINAEVFNWRIMAGPMASFVVNSKVKDLNTLSGPLASADIRKANWYVQVGTGIDVFFLTLDLRYQIALNNMITTVTNDVNGTSYNLNATNKVWVVSLGFKI